MIRSGDEIFHQTPNATYLCLASSANIIRIVHFGAPNTVVCTFAGGDNQFKRARAIAAANAMEMIRYSEFTP